jgi:filamentous hemagglutinin
LGGQYLARASLQEDSSEAVLDYLRATAHLSQAFVAAGSVAVPLAGAQGTAASTTTRGAAAVAGEEAGTVSVFRKMSSAEAEATLQTGQLQPAMKSANPTRYLSESLEKLQGKPGVAPFENAWVKPGTRQEIIEFAVEREGYNRLMSTAVPQAGSKGINAVKIHYEGLTPGGPLRNIGVPPTRLDEFNKLIQQIRKVPPG